MKKCPKCHQYIRDGNPLMQSELIAMALPPSPREPDPEDAVLADLKGARDQAAAVWQAALAARAAAEAAHERAATALATVVAGYSKSSMTAKRVEELTKDERERAATARRELMAVLELEAERRGELNALSLRIDVRRVELRVAASMAAAEAQRPGGGAAAARDALLARIMGDGPAGEAPAAAPSGEAA